MDVAFSGIASSLILHVSQSSSAKKYEEEQERGKAGGGGESRGRSGVSGGWVDGISKDYRTIPSISLLFDS